MHVRGMIVTVLLIVALAMATAACISRSNGMEGASQQIVVAPDMSRLYDAELLDRWLPRFRSHVESIRRDNIRVLLTNEGRQILDGAHVLLPRPGDRVMSRGEWWDPSKGVFVFAAGGNRILIPLVSVKFLHDMIFAHLWLSDNGYQVATVDYIHMLKYWEACNRTGRPPRPFQAMGIPSTPQEEPPVTDVELSRKFRRVFQAALLFVMSHEVAHLIQSAGGSQIEREGAADGWAFSIMARNKSDPTGMFLFFLFSAFWAPNPADFPSPEQYDYWLRNKADHPLTGERIAAFGRLLEKNVMEYFPDAAPSDPRLDALKVTGRMLVDVARPLSDLTASRRLRLAACDIDPSSLTLRKNE